MTASAKYHFFLLRGLAREKRHWGSFTTLIGSGSSSKVTPLELPGCGELRRSKSPSRVEHYLPILRSQYLRQATTQTTNVIVGISFGGMIAANWLYTYQEDFQAAIIINTSSRESPGYQRLTAKARMTLLHTLICRSNYDKERLILESICNMANIDKIAREWALIRDQAPVFKANGFRQLLAAHRFRWPGKLHVPTLLLVSEQDRFVSPQCSAWLAKRWELTLIMHRQAGHDLSTDDPQWCSSTITAWLDELKLARNS